MPIVLVNAGRPHQNSTFKLRSKRFIQHPHFIARDDDPIDFRRQENMVLIMRQLHNIRACQEKFAPAAATPGHCSLQLFEPAKHYSSARDRFIEAWCVRKADAKLSQSDIKASGDAVMPTERLGNWVAPRERHGASESAY